MEAPIRRLTGQIIMPLGTHCPLTPEYCMDAEGAEIFWPPHRSLPFQYDILYKGLATRLSPKDNQSTLTIYTVTQDTSFALTKTSDIDVCGYRLVQTEYPKFLILET